MTLTAWALLYLLVAMAFLLYNIYENVTWALNMRGEVRVKDVTEEFGSVLFFCFFWLPFGAFILLIIAFEKLGDLRREHIEEFVLYRRENSEGPS